MFLCGQSYLHTDTDISVGVRPIYVQIILQFYGSGLFLGCVR